MNAIGGPPQVPLLTHLPDAANLYDANPLCGATLEDSLTGSIRLMADYTDCHVCLDLKVRA